jgi:hypothetical protein
MATTYSVQVLADAPIGWWRFQDVGSNPAADSSGSGNNMDYHGSPTRNATGPLTAGQTTYSMVCAASPTKMYAGPVTSSTPLQGYYGGRQALSLECWILSADTASDQGDIVGWDHTHQVVLTYGPGGDLAFFTNQSFAPGTSINICDGKWHHVVGTWAGDGVGSATIKLYLDGVLVATGSGTVAGGVLPANATDLPGVGAGITALTTSDNNAIGSVAEPAIYPQALTAARVYAHYLAASGQTPGNGGLAHRNWFMYGDEA